MSFNSQIVNHELNWTSTGSQAPTNWGLTYGCPQHIASSLDTPGKAVSSNQPCYYYLEDLSLESRRTERQAMSPACVRTVIVCVNFAIPWVGCAYVGRRFIWDRA